MSDVEQVPMNLPTGISALRLGKAYETTVEGLYEGVQNAIDGHEENNRPGKKVWVAWDMRPHARRYAVRDNGRGFTREHMNEYLKAKMLDSPKKGEVDKYGQFGQALLAHMGFAKKQMLTSCPKSSPDQGYRTWTWNVDQVVSQKGPVSIPSAARPELRYSTNGGKGFVYWRTELLVEGITADKSTSRMPPIDMFVQAVFQKYGVKFREKGVGLDVAFIYPDGKKEVREDQRPSQYTGRPLESYIRFNRAAGNVKIGLYLAQFTTKGYGGKVGVGTTSNPSRVDLVELAKGPAGAYLSDEVVAAFKMKIFEGEIAVDKIVMRPDRKGFEDNEALAGFCAELMSWYQKVGSTHVEAIRDQRDQKKQQALQRQSLKTIESMLADPRFTDLKRQTIDSFTFGTIGRGHTPPPGSTVVGEQDEKALVAKFGSDDTRTGRGGSGGTTKDPKEPKEGHRPFSALGPKGQVRTQVKGHSTGLQFSQTVMEGSDRLWMLDAERGIIHFNVRHSLWVECEKGGDGMVLQFQEIIATLALLIHSSGSSERAREDYQIFVETCMPAINYLVTTSPSFKSGRLVKPDEH